MTSSPHPSHLLYLHDKATPLPPEPNPIIRAPSDFLSWVVSIVFLRQNRLVLSPIPYCRALRYGKDLESSPRHTKQSIALENYYSYCVSLSTDVYNLNVVPSSPSNPTPRILRPRFHPPTVKPGITPNIPIQFIGYSRGIRQAFLYLPTNTRKKRGSIVYIHLQNDAGNARCGTRSGWFLVVTYAFLGVDQCIIYDNYILAVPTSSTSRSCSKNGKGCLVELVGTLIGK